MEEIWKDIKGYEDLYKVSNRGIVVNKKTGLIKTPYIRKESGSLYVGLNKNSKTVSMKIDRLLYETFGIDNQNTDNIEDEIWEDIKGYEGCYKVSNYGRVKSLDRYINQRNQFGGISSRFMKGKIMSSIRDNGADYKIVSFQDGYNNLPQNYYIHILVAEHFISNPNNLPQVNHKDGDKSNNKVHNLEWCTEKENTQHAIETRLMIKDKNTGQNILKYKITDEDIINIYKQILEGKYTYKEIANEYNVPRIYIQKIKGRSNKRYKQLLDKFDENLRIDNYIEYTSASQIIKM